MPKCISEQQKDKGVVPRRSGPFHGVSRGLLSRCCHAGPGRGGPGVRTCGVAGTRRLGPLQAEPTDSGRKRAARALQQPAAAVTHSRVFAFLWLPNGCHQLSCVASHVVLHHPARGLIESKTAPVRLTDETHPAASQLAGVHRGCRPRRPETLAALDRMRIFPQGKIPERATGVGGHRGGRSARPVASCEPRAPYPAHWAPGRP